MKNLLLTVLLSGVSLMAYEIDVVVTDMLNDRGQVYVGLYNKAEDFSVVDKAYRTKILKSNTKTLKYKFKDIPNATYSIAIFHDENRNNILDKSFLGMPTEGYGFSNNIRPLFRAANFEESLFVVDSDKTITVKMAY